MSDHVHSLNSLSTALIIFMIAGILVPVLQKTKISPILGYLMCGVILGPFGLAHIKTHFPGIHHFTISDSATIGMLGEIGIVFLMFMIGLELSLQRLFDMRRLVLGLGAAQIALTSIVIAAFSIVFGNNFQSAIIIGLSFSLSSTAIVMQLLREQHKTNRLVGLVAFSILLMQDLAVVPLLVILGSLAGERREGEIFLVVLESLFIAAVVVVSMYVIGKKVIKPLLSYLSLAKNPEWLVSLIFLLTIGCSALTQSFGLSAALGAFLAGLLISETDFKHEVEIIIEPVKSLLLGIFFLSVGMQVDPEVIVEHPIWLPLSVVGLFLIKIVCLYPLSRAFQVPKEKSMEVAIRLAQAGEFALLVLGIALSSKIIDESSGEFLLMVVVLSIFTTPLFTKTSAYVIGKLGYKTNYQVLSQDDSVADYHGSSSRYSDNPSVLVAGYGRVGRLLGNILESQEIRFVAIESDYKKVQELRNQGHRVIFADARKIDIWRKFYIGSVKVIVIAIDQPESTELILKLLRAEYPDVPILVRTHDTVHMEHLFNLGATEVIPEALEAGIAIASKTMSLIGVNDVLINAEVERERKRAKLRHTDTT